MVKIGKLILSQLLIFCRRPCLSLPLLLFMRKKILMRCGEKRCWRFVPYIGWRPTSQVRTSHVPDSNVSRPRFGRLSPQIRSSLVPRSIKGIGSGLACYGCSFLYLYGVHTNSKASKHIVSEKYAFKWLQTLVILYSCGHYVMFFQYLCRV